MKKIYLLGFVFFSVLTFSQNFGSFASGVKINNTIYNVTASAPIHQINPNAGAQNFDGITLGTFGQNSTCAKITGSEIKTFKTATGNVCGTTLLWRVYALSATPSGTFNIININSVTDCNITTNTFNDGFGPCGLNDQKWKDYTLNVDFINGLAVGSYILEIYYSYTGSNTTPATCETTNFISNFGANFKANFTISNPTNSPTVSSTSVCEGNLLTLTANPSNGVAPYTYNWTGPNGYSSTVQNPTITTTLANSGIYSLTITDSCGAVSQIQSTQEVTVNEKITPTFDAIYPAICNGGTPPILPNLSTNGITGTWNPAVVSNTATANYLFTPDAGQCANTYTQTIFVINNVTPTFTLPASICQGSTAPTLQNISNNGIQGTWNPTTVSNTTTGSYVFTPNTGQCAVTRTITITVNPNVTPTFSIPTSICANSTAPILPTTSTNGINGTWSPSTVSNTTTGTYVFTHSASQCATNFSITITVNPNITPTFNAIPPICQNATAPILPTTSTNGITGTWNPATVSNTASGTYNFTPNAGQCALTTTLSVTVNPNVTPTFNAIPNVCYNSTAPTLPTTSNNGITGTWNPATVSNTTSGTYTFTPTAGLCATTASIIINVTTINPTFNDVAPICSGTTAPVLPTTSNNGITGTWNPSMVSNTASGTYTFTPNPNQCATTATLSVTVNPNITPTFTAIAPICSGATAPVLQSTSNNGISGTWNPATVSNTASGTYTFTPNSGICATTATLSVTVNPNITPTFNAIAPICENATAPILPTSSTNGITGTWNPATVSNTASGTYTFTPNSGVCSTTITLSIIVNPNVTPTFDEIPNVCYNSTAPTLPTTSNNGITGTWNPATVSNTTSGTYTFTPTAGQCATSTSITINVTTINPTFNDVAPICSGTTAPVLPTTSNNGITGTWNPSTVSNTASGTYTFTPNPNQCATTATLSVTVTPNIVPTFTAIAPFCSGTTAPILPSTSNNEISGTWNPATVSNTASGTYTFTPTSGVCATTANLTVTVNPNITPTFNAIAPICANATAPILPTTSTNGISGTWNPATVNNTASGTYTFTPNSGVCATITEISIIVNPNVTPTFDTIAPICENATAPILPTTSNNGISGNWNPATVSNTASGTYVFTPNAGQCATTTSLSVTVNPNIIPTFTPITDVCYQTTSPTLPSVSNNGISGTWNPSVISNTASGTYTFTPNTNQCATTATLSVNVTTIVPTFNTLSPICYETTAPTLQSTSNNGITGIWNPAVVSNTASGTYTFTPNANQCATTVTITTTVTTITPTFEAIPPICYSSTAPTLQTTSNNGISGTWNPATVSTTESGTYTFTPNSNQCATEVSITTTITTITPTFDSISAICENATAPILPTTSNNGINGIWNPATVSNTASGTYIFTPNANQCATTTSLSVTVNPNVTPFFNEYPPVCYLTTPPALPLVSNNGISGTWNPATVSNTSTGTYVFTPDFGICATTASITIVVTIVNPTFNAIPDVCYGSTAPTLQSVSNNGITGTWNPSVVSNINSAIYTFTPDANQCATTATLSINVNAISPLFTSIPAICENSTAPVLPTTSNNGITGSWNPFPVSNTISATYTFTPDANQCAIITSVTITVTPIVVPTFDAIPAVCYNSLAPILPTTSTNGIAGTWNPATVSNTASATYTFTPNFGECATTTTLDVVVNSITPTFNVVAPICENANAPILPITSTNGISGTWNPANVNTTTSGTYTFTPNENQCATTASLEVIVNPNVTPTFNEIPPVCYNSLAPILPSTSTNGISGTWNPSVISNTTAGTYIFTPGFGICATTATLTTTINTVTPTFTAIADVCYGSTAPNLPTTSTNGITGTWNPSTVSNTVAQTYTFTPDANQCATDATLSIGINAIAPTLNAIADVCYGSVAPSLPNSSTNGITGTWNPATISNTTPQTYTFTPDANQCATIATLAIGINSITPDFTAVAPICENSIAPILPTTSNNGIIGVWNPAVNTTATTIYTFTPNANQCATTTTLTIVVNTKTLPLFSYAASSNACQGFSAQVLIPTTSNNGISGTWNPNTIDYSALGTIIYSFTPNTTECATATSFSITVVPNITPTFNAIAPLCSGDASPVLPLISTNGYTGTWNPATVSTTASATYTFTPTTGQCATTTTLNIIVNPSPTDVEVIVSSVLNQTSQGVIEITNVTNGVSPFVYSLNNGSFSSTTTYTNLTPGDYTITVQDANGCEYEKTVTIETTCIFPKGLSPNGDGKNDTYNLGGCNVIRIEFFNRYGTKVNSFSNYSSQWNGSSNDGNTLPDGTYFYSAEMADGNVKTGWVYIIR